jgi:hypothetical protein
MSIIKKTYYKALLLFIVFSLNTVVSFACSFSSLFHGFHHHENSVTVEHKHEGNHRHSSDKKHNEAQSNHTHDSGSTKNSKDDCCSKSVIEIEKIEKAVSRTIEAPHAIFVASLFAAYSEIFSLSTVYKVFFTHIVRWRLPATIQDLRIVIQSFQI